MTEPDRFEKILRFVCGFVFGAGVSFLVALREVTTVTAGVWAIVGFVALGSGFLAMRLGDEFWRNVSDWFRH